MEFEYPWLLLLIFLVAAAAWAAWMMVSPSIKVSSTEAFVRVRKHLRESFDWKKCLTLLCFFLAGCAIVVVLAGPREGSERVRIKSDGIDIILVLDLSGSMNALDVPSDVRSVSELSSMLKNGELKNRLETAKDEISRFVEARPNDRIGLIVFADLPYSVCPPTLDHSFLLANLKRWEAGAIGDGTGIASPLASAVNRLRSSDAKSRIVVLFTDGADNVAAKVSPRDASRIADQFGIRIYTVGIGGNNAVWPQTNMFGQTGFVPYPSEYDEGLLKDIAAFSGGRYYHAQDADSMAQAMDDINQLERTSMEQMVSINWKELYPVFCYIAIGFLLAGWLLQERIFLRIP